MVIKKGFPTRKAFFVCVVFVVALHATQLQKQHQNNVYQFRTAILITAEAPCSDTILQK